MKKSSKPPRKSRQTVIALEDLAPRQNPTGGRGGFGKTVFGEEPILASADERKASEKKARRER